jgi:hypothetical protein
MKAMMILSVLLLVGCASARSGGDVSVCTKQQNCRCDKFKPYDQRECYHRIVI